MTLLLGPPGSGKTTLLLALAGKLGKDFDRNAEVQLGQEYGPKPKIWRVYVRKNKRGVKRNDVALNQA